MMGSALVTRLVTKQFAGATGMVLPTAPQSRRKTSRTGKSCSEKTLSEPEIPADPTDPEVRLGWLTKAKENYDMKFSFENLSFNKVSSFKARILHAEN